VEWSEPDSTNTSDESRDLSFPEFSHPTNRKGGFFIQPAFDQVARFA
jgi:hypothetical protein